MSRFVFNRKSFAVFCAASLVAGNVMIGSSMPSYADTSWADLLKPLVKDVLVPGASMGMKKLTQHIQKKQAGNQEEVGTDGSTVSSDGSTSWTDAFTSTVTTSTEPNSTEASSTESFSTPEEPMTTSSSDAGGDSTKPEEPINMSYAATGSDLESPPPPPPPVETP